MPVPMSPVLEFSQLNLHIKLLKNPALLHSLTLLGVVYGDPISMTSIKCAYGE